MGLQLATVLALAILSQGTPQVQSVDSLSLALNGLSQEARADSSTGADVEEKYLLLTRAYPEPEQLGRIYAGLVETLAQIGLHESAGRVATYGAKALKYPLEASLRISVYLRLGEAISVQNKQAGNQSDAEALQKEVSCYVEAIRLMAELDIPAGLQELPAVGRLRGSGTLYDRQRLENEKRLEERERAKAANELVRLRFNVESNLASAYLGVPDSAARLRALVETEFTDKKQIERIEKIFEDLSAGRLPSVPRAREDAAVQVKQQP